MKVVINDDLGGFGLSKKALELLGTEDTHKYYNSDMRGDPKLVEVVEKLGEEANGFCADLKIVEIPDDVEWIIGEYDGSEWVAEKHRIWR